MDARVYNRLGSDDRAHARRPQAREQGDGHWGTSRGGGPRGSHETEVKRARVGTEVGCLKGELLRPAEAAARLGIATNTLRVYSVRFASLLGDPAARPAASVGGRPGHRLYSEGDLAVVARAHAHVEAGLTYEQALDRLRGGAQTETLLSPGRSRRTVGVSDAGQASLQEAVDAWKALAEERAREVAELRGRVARLEAELEASRMASRRDRP